MEKTLNTTEISGAAPPDWRGLCEELVELDAERPSEYSDWKQRWNAAIKRARAALAEPVAEGPTDEELLKLAAEALEYERIPYAAEGGAVEAYHYELLNFARAVLARFGHQPAPPTEGEVEARNVAGLFRRWADAYPDSVTVDPHWLTRAAELLEQRHPAPVPVSEKPLAQEAYIAFVQICKGNSDDAGTYEDDEKLVRSALKRLAELEVFPQRQATPVPAGMIPVEYWDIDSGARIVTEPSEEGPGGCWVVLNSRHVNPFTEFPTAKAAWDALQQAHALPLPAGGGAAMSDTNRPPLWQVLMNAGDPPCSMQEMAAAEIRALRDWLVPEEAEPTGMRPCGDTYSAQSIKRGERQRLRALLTAEADRAERGDG